MNALLLRKTRATGETSVRRTNSSYEHNTQSLSRSYFSIVRCTIESKHPSRCPSALLRGEKKTRASASDALAYSRVMQYWYSYYAYEDLYLCCAQTVPVRKKNWRDVRLIGLWDAGGEGWKGRIAAASVASFLRPRGFHVRALRHEHLYIRTDFPWGWWRGRWPNKEKPASA